LRRYKQALASSSAVADRQRDTSCYQHGAAGPWQVVTLIAVSNRRRLLMRQQNSI